MPKTSIGLIFTSCLALLLAGCGGNDGARQDYSTPQAAVRSYYSALEHRDPVALRESFASGADQAYVNAMVGLMDAWRELHEQAASHLGREVARSLDVDGGPRSVDYAAINAAEVQMRGEDSAVFRTDTVHIHLVLENGAWKVLNDDLLITPEQRGEATQMMQALAGELRQIAERIASGEIRDREIRPVRTEIGTRVQAVLAGG